MRHGGGGGPEDSDDYAQMQQRERASEQAAVVAAEREARAAISEKEKTQQQVIQLQQRVQQAEQTADQARRAAAAAEAASRQKEGEVMRLIKEKDNAQFGGGNDALQEKVGEMEDELYEVRTQLEDEQERANALQVEVESLKSQAAHGGASAAGQMQALQMELEDMREAKEKAEAMLARAMGG